MTRALPCSFAALSLSFVGVACTSNPTPHPANGGEDTYVPADDTTAGGGAADKAHEQAVCDALGGRWQDDTCLFAAEGFADAALPEPVAPPRADVVAVTVGGDPGARVFDVTVASDDSGCDAYADWWEILTVDRELVYRRILTHPHVAEQPFTRGSGPLAIADDLPIMIRAHFHPNGYGSETMIGSVRGGFTHARTDGAFASDLATHEPLPGECTPDDATP